MAKEQYIMQLASLEQEANKFQEQMYLLDQQMTEMQAIAESLDALEKSEDDTIYANLGKNLFIKTKVIDKKLLVDVGNKTFVKKDMKETISLIEVQLKKIMDAKKQILDRISEIQEQMQAIVAQAEKEAQAEEN